MPPTLRVSTTIDQSSTLAMVQVGTTQLTQAMEFAAGQIANGIRFNVFNRVVSTLGAKAGRAFPGVYQEHLLAFMHMPDKVPILTEVLGPGIIAVEYNLEGLGDYRDFSLGYHHNALIDTGFSADEKRKKKNFVIHPATVPFPPGWTGEDLLNSDERRLEWWTKAIIGRNPDAAISPNTPQSVRFLQKNNLPTYAQIVKERVFNAWIPAGKAPEWLILENGTHDKGGGAPPAARPQDFTFVLRTASMCYAEEIMRAAIITLHETAIATGGNVRSYAVSGGRTQLATTIPQVGNRFISFKEKLASSLGDVSGCFEF